jgi:hypothetical protein
VTDVDLIRAQLKILHQLFAGTKPKKPLQHPGVRREALLRELLLSGGLLRLPEQQSQLQVLGRAWLDSAILTELTRGDLSALQLGKVANLGDARVLKKVLTRVSNPTQFEDVFAELSAAAWYQSRGHVVELLEVDGLPDLKVAVVDMEDPLYIECKRMQTKSGEAIKKDIKDANRKFRRIGERHFGVVMIDVTAAITPTEEATDELPNGLQELIQIAQRTLSGPKNRGVAKVILTWDEHIALPNAEKPDAIAFRRRRVIIDHACTDSVRPLPPMTPLFEGFTTLANLYWRPRWLGLQQVALSPPANAAADMFGLQPRDFLEAFERHDKIDVVPCGSDLEVVVFLLRRELAGARRDLLAWGSVSSNLLNVHGGLVLPSSLCSEAEEWTLAEILRAIVTRYGLDIQTPNQRSRFIQYDRFPCELGKLPVIVHDSTEGVSITFAAVRWLNEPSGSDAEVAFLFGVRVDLLMSA